MENAIEPVQGSQALAGFNPAELQQEREQSFEEVGGNRQTFHPRIGVAGGFTEEVKSGKIRIGTWFMTKGKNDDIIQLDANIVAVPLGWRAKAMFFGSTPPLYYHNQKSPEYQDIKAKADQKIKKYGYGPEFLLWNPEFGYFTYFMSNPTGRNESPNLHTLLPKPDGRLFVANLGIKLIDDGENKWHGPNISLSSQQLGSPPDETFQLTFTEFMKPKDSPPPAVVTAAAPEAAREDR